MNLSLRGGRMAILVRPLIIVLIVIVVFLTLLWLGQRRLIYFPDRSTPPSATQVFEGGNDVTLETEDGLHLGAWWIPPRGQDRQITVLVANGNGGNRLGRAGLANALADKGFAVLLFDYRGYGGNPGDPTEHGLAMDIRAARAAVDGRVIYFGESMGAAVVTELATEIPPAGLLLRSPFTDLPSVGAQHYPLLPVRMLLRESFPVKSHIARITVPTVVVYGSADTIVPPEHSREVARNAPGLIALIEIPDADHNDSSLFDGPDVVNAVVTLADRISG